MAISAPQKHFDRPSVRYVGIWHFSSHIRYFQAVKSRW
jgi:hypothetical protein